MKKLMLILIILISSFTLTACQPPSPTDYLGTTWVCEEPYMWFEVQNDEMGRWGFGQVEDENGELIDVRFSIEMGTCYILRKEDAYLVTNEEGYEVTCEGEPLHVGRHVRMRRMGKVMTLETSNYNNYEKDQLYHGKYKTLTFELQGEHVIFLGRKMLTW